MATSSDTLRRTAREIFAKVEDNAHEELRRSTHALAFSGLAGGLTMGLTGIGVAAAMVTLGNTPSRDFVAYMIYPIGFSAVISATLPVSAMGAHRAARQIVDAAARGASEVVLTPQAKLMALAHGVAPGTVADILGMANRFMPGTGSHDPHRFTGKEGETSVSRSFLTALGRSAGRDLNQHPERGPVGGDANVSSRPLRPRPVSSGSKEVLAD